MAGSPLAEFTDFMSATDSKVLTGPEVIQNEAFAESYLIDRFMRGTDISETIQYGSKIKDYIMFDESNTFGSYLPGETVTWENPQVLNNWEADWRFYKDHMSWTAQELELNGNETQEARRTQYKRLKKIKEGRVVTSTTKGLEARLFAAPNATTMEAAGAQEMYSLPVFINEETDGTYDGFTTVMGINPATYPKWKNQIKQYDAADPDDTDGDLDGLFNAFDNMHLSTNFKTPQAAIPYVNQPISIRNQMILTSKAGMIQVKDVMRKSQDRFVAGPQDAGYGNPMHNGRPIEYISALDTLAIYDDGSSGRTTEALATDAGARYWFINANKIRMIWHANRFMHKHAVREPDNQMDAYVMPISTWGNLITQSRRCHGIVKPGA